TDRPEGILGEPHVHRQIRTNSRHGISRPRSRQRALAVQSLRPCHRLRPSELQERLPTLRPRSAGGPSADRFRRLQFFSRSQLDSYRRILLSRLWDTGRNRVSSAGASDHRRHRTRFAKFASSPAKRPVCGSQQSIGGRRVNSIDIDVGGTFTDLVLNFGGQTLIRKVPTTPHDLSVCFSRVIEDVAAALGMKIDQLLPSVEMIRYSTTIALNRLIEKKGPRLALI